MQQMPVCPVGVCLDGFERLGGIEQLEDGGVAAFCLTNEVRVELELLSLAVYRD